MFGISWIKIAIGLVILTLIGYTHLMTYKAGKQAVLTRLQNDRITILKDGKRIDEEVFSADDDMLCTMLGGCLPNSAENN